MIDMHFIFRKVDDDQGRTHELAQSAVKCMRGILFCWIRQADKVRQTAHWYNIELKPRQKYCKCIIFIVYQLN